METPDWLKKVGIKNIKDIEKVCEKQELQQQSANDKFFDASIANTEQEYRANIDKIRDTLDKENNAFKYITLRINNLVKARDQTDDPQEKEHYQKFIDQEEKNIDTYLTNLEKIKKDTDQEIQRKEQTDEHIEIINDTPITLN